jgi:hypothetical protein
MNKKQNTINPRLASQLKRRRTIALQLAAFNAVAKAIEPFPIKVQRRAMQAAWELIKPKP